jgi:hypothetical protein
MRTFGDRKNGCGLRARSVLPPRRTQPAVTRTGNQFPWRLTVALSALVVLDLAISLPVRGATYRPFSWMSIAPAGVAKLYPVIQDVSFVGGKPTVAVEVSTGVNVTLQRSTKLRDAAGWRDVATTTATGQVIHLIDTNPVSRAVFYRVKQLPGRTP